MRPVNLKLKSLTKITKGRFFLAWLVAFILITLVGFGLRGGAFYLWNRKLSDTLFIKRKPNSQIVIVAIDDKSISAIGRWPWDRGVHARLIDNLSQMGADVIGIDITFSEVSNEEQDTLLKNSIQNSQALIILAAEGQNLRLKDSNMNVDLTVRPLSLFLSDNASYGTINLIPDRDGIIRTIPLKLETGQGDVINSFPLEILTAYYTKQNITRDIEKQVTSVEKKSGVMLINYFGPPSTFPIYSISDILNGQIDKVAIEDKIVLIGATAQDLHDDGVTPVSGKPMSGVEMHANALSTLINEDYLIPESEILSFFTSALIAFGLSLLFVLLPLKIVLLAGCISLIAYLSYAFISFDAGIVRNLIYPPLVIITSTIANIGYKYLIEQSQKRYIRKAMAYYLSPAIMEEVLSEPEKLQLGGKREDISVLFSDIAGFTGISEKLSAVDLSKLVNEYLTTMTNIVFEERGVLDKYIGDSVMAFWGAPVDDELHALHAVITAIKMQEETAKIAKRWHQKGIPNFHIRIGINTGEAVVGNMGSNLRFDYTVMGDTVNLASRLEGINKHYKSKMIISKMTYDQVKKHVIVRKLDCVVVKGKRKGVMIYELRGLGKASKTEVNFLEKFEQARKMYEKGWFKRAYKAFQKLHTTYPKDGPIKTYLNRCRELKKDRPKKWDGIYKAESK